jgi:hypothetical protein
MFLACAVTAPRNTLTPTRLPLAITPTPINTPPPTDQAKTCNLRVQVTDGQQPTKATIRLYWPDTGGEFTIGPTSDIVLPIPADTKTLSITVTAPGFQDWSQELTPTKSSNLVVRLIRK